MSDIVGLNSINRLAISRTVSALGFQSQECKRDQGTDGFEAQKSGLKKPITLDKNFGITCPTQDELKKFLAQFEEGDLNSFEKKMISVPHYLQPTVLQYNTEMINRDVRAIKPKGIHIPKSAKGQLGEELVSGLENGTIRFDKLTEEQKDLLVVQLGEKDVVKPPPGKLLDNYGFFKPDGNAFSYTLFPEHGLHRIGMPQVIYTKEGENQNGQPVTQDVDPDSLRIALFRRPDAEEAEVGYYFQVSESSKEKDVVYNGAIVPSDTPLAISNNNKGEVYIVNPSGK